MNYRKNILIIILSCITCIIWNIEVKAQNDLIHLQHDTLDPHERPIVVFPHSKHEERIECIRCHHDFDEYGVNIGSEGESCGSCHGRKQGLKELREAFHGQCIGCHRELLRKKLPTGPILCADCHKGESKDIK